MENIKEVTEKADVSEATTKSAQDAKLQLKENETSCENQPQENIDEADEDYDEDDDDDDDDEKDISQKLIIDIPEEEEVEEEEEDGDDEDLLPLQQTIAQQMLQGKNLDKTTGKQVENAIITLSDGEEVAANTGVAIKPGKVQKRRSVGAASTAAVSDEERYRLKRRKINVAGAPKMPLTGYVRYMNDRREILRKEHPSKSAMEHTKMIGEEWQAMSADLKSPYLKAADVDKQRYVNELQGFLKSRPDILASELAKNKIRKPTEPIITTVATTKSLGSKEKTQLYENFKPSKDLIKNKQIKAAIPSTSQQATDKLNIDRIKRKRTPTPPSTIANATTSTLTFVTPTPGEIPIFTNEFLEHNKVYDMELRSLRKSKTDLEQQNSVLEKHVENMKFGVEKMMSENNELQEKNRLLEIYLDKLKRKLAQALGTLPLPSAPSGATVDNIDRYMQDLYKMSTSNSHGPATLNKAKDIIRKLDLQIQL